MKLEKNFFIILAAIIIFQFSIFGLKYFEVVDDNNQLGIFNMQNDNISENVIKTYKSYNIRPLAFISDAYIFQWFWNNMYTLLLIILIMHMYSIYLLYKICDKINIKLNAFCLILFALSPMLVEGLYWISASTRIVVSVFFMLLSIHLLLKSFDEEYKKKKFFYLIISIFLNLICVGYYEQTVPLNFLVFTFVMICIKKYKYIAIPTVSTLWIGAWYVYFMANGQMQARGAVDLSGMLGAAKELIKNVFMYYRNAYYNFTHSVEITKSLFYTSIPFIILFVLIMAFIYYIYKNKCTKDENQSILKKTILGLIIFISPFTPFIVLKTSMLAVRNFYMPTLGLAIIIGVLVDLVLKLVKNEIACNIIKTTLISSIIITFVMANIDGINDYKKTKIIDDKIVNQIVEAIGENAFKERKTISVNYNYDELLKYKNLTNYVQCVIESDWALMGKIQVHRQSRDIGNVHINSMQEEADYILYFDNEMNLVKVNKK